MSGQSLMGRSRRAAQTRGDRALGTGRGMRSWQNLAAICATWLIVLAVGTAPAAARVVDFGDIVIDDTRGVVKIDPASGAQTMLLTNHFTPFTHSISFFGVAADRAGNIVVAASEGFKSGPSVRSVERLDAATGARTGLSRWVPAFTGEWTSQWMAVEADGDILLITDKVIRLNPLTRSRTTVSSGESFVTPRGIAVERDGDIIVADAGEDAVIRVDPVSGAHTTLSSGGALADPVGVAVERDGAIIVADAKTVGGSGAVVRIDQRTGAQTTVSSGGSFVEPRGVAIGADGSILVADARAVAGPPPQSDSGAVIGVDPKTGAQKIFSSLGGLSSPDTIAVISPPNEPPDCSTVTATPDTLPRAARDQLKTISLSGATDADGDALSFQIGSVEQDEPVSGGPAKRSFPDAQLVGATADTNQVRVRAERSPVGNGRVYRIAYTVSDGTASCAGLQKVSVQRHKYRSAVDDGDASRWDSFTARQVLP